ncbi:sigma-54-dependent transcriptional regulator [Desulfofustis glycolicus]|uniref:Two-component system, NtrC family, response regulator AtoC n=1 Tax=Desulfofustis glycolicus DSM 9705 TaxID=1121409 RepID=A0A1M5T016_9BACT|nr:sigma-54 dependent transcriptional regulator [Desulfofustis glycolicus]MCB2215287.1 sigma-54 dependent transcriptional regulator [Desulfobulbaceae bacterium]SHH44032.1 two-component system, NtrC family, response regulator AtoC [Desulfofustis glycolicus DSM 9705]
MSDSILLVEDEKILRISLSDALRAEGFSVLAVEDGEAALTALEKGAFSLVITDIRLPGIGGTEILKKSLAEAASTPVIMMTGFGSIEDAVQAMRLGAFDYITKPFDLDELILVARKAIEVHSLTEENIRLKKELSTYYGGPNIIGESKAMQTIFALLDKISRTDSTVLILGESGTGKELIASTIHFQSGRKHKPIIRVNCAALPSDLIESELFGYEKGAFTGADARKPGRFDLADGGTLFLDEIGDLPPLTQTKILRFLEERSFERLGGTTSVSVDVRIIAATNKNLEEEVKNGSFREDLYYRLNVIPLVLPPLRKRTEDIPLLIDLFTRRFNDQLGTAVRFDAEALVSLANYSFPGNVRELLNVVERCVSLAGGKIIGKDELPDHIGGARRDKARVATLHEITAEAEKKHINTILKLTQGNRSRAAEILGISRKTLWEKINAHRLDL